MSDIIPNESNPLEEMNKPHVGDVYYDHWSNLFLKLDEIEGSTLKFLTSEDGKRWYKLVGSDDGKKRQKIIGMSDLHHYQKLHLSPGEDIYDAISSLKKEMIERFINPREDIEDNEEKISNSTDLMVTGNKAHYEEMAFSLERAQARVKIIEHMAKKRMEQFSQQAHALSGRLSDVRRVIGILETYLGAHEEIIQIQEGQRASPDEKICIRQLILYMDEEAGLVEVYRDNKRGGGDIRYDGFIHFANVGKFDEWLLKDDNLDAILPEKKGIVALRPSRQDHYKNEDFFSKGMKDRENRMIYLLVRNGENIYRIFTSMANEEKNLFPTLAEAERIEKVFSNDNSWGSTLSDAKKSRETWLNNTLLIQGLLDRSPIFLPLSIARINLTDPATYEGDGLIRMIRDGELTIADGKLSFDDWRKSLNEGVKRGSRIYFFGLEWSKDGHSNRFPNFYSYNNNYPPIPDDGIYTIEDIYDEERWNLKHYRFLYLPTDKVWTRYDSHDRKKRYLFSVYRDEFLNYDDIDIADIDYYLKSRFERRDFLRVIPILIGIRRERLKELEAEKAFVKLLSEKHSIPEEKLWELVDWWKKKVINKRPLSQDDAKAWRMIIREAKE